MLNIAVFVSGRGSNLRAVQAAIEAGRLDARIRMVLGSRDDVPALTWAQEQDIPTAAVPKAPAEETAAFILSALREHDVDFVALAGYLKLIPADVVRAFRHRILNIHPALLPAFGGPGMYGHHVHEAVLEAGVRVSGATVHLVDEAYDRGPIVLQECVPVQDDDNPESLAARVLEVEHRLFPTALQLFAAQRVHVRDGKVTIQQ